MRTPTDILGQHIHLVKFDVTASDGAANGFNYEDGTFSPEEVRRADRRHPGPEQLHRRATRATAPWPVRWPSRIRSSAPAREASGWAPRPRCSAGTPTPCATTTASTARCGPSSPTTTSAPRPTSRPASTPAWWSSRRARTGCTTRPARRSTTRHDGGPTSWQAVINAARQRRLPRVPARVRRLPARLLRGGGDLPRPRRGDQPAGARRGRPARPAAQAPPSAPAATRRRARSWSRPTTPAPCRSTTATSRSRCGCANPATNSQAAGNAGDLSFAFANLTRADADFNVQPTFYAAAHSGRAGQGSVHAAAANLRQRPRPDPRPGRRARRGAQLQRPRHQVAVRAVGAPTPATATAR